MPVGSNAVTLSLRSSTVIVRRFPCRIGHQIEADTRTACVQVVIGAAGERQSHEGGKSVALFSQESPMASDLAIWRSSSFLSSRTLPVLKDHLQMAENIAREQHSEALS